MTGLVEEHGHFVTNPDKYTPLKVPARPDGRDFTVRRKKDPVTGVVRTEIEWTRPRYELGELREGTVQTGVAARGERWRTVGDDGQDGPPVGPAPSTPLVPSGSDREQTGRPLAGQRPAWHSPALPGDPEPGQHLMARHDLVERHPEIYAATTHAELAERLQGKLRAIEGVHLVVVLGDGDLTLLKQAAAELADQAARWPEVFRHLEEIRAERIEAPCTAEASADGRSLRINTYWWDDARAFRGAVASKNARRAVPANTAGPDGIMREEVGHLVKIWLDSDPDIAKELASWLDSNPMPRGYARMTATEERTAARRRHETVARGYRGIGFSGASLTWQGKFEAKLAELVARRRGT
ncbi:MAG: hypothetical protein HUU35_10170 [Armatimonadetes bacterium]|nr:hypothetical protein [Armatimonadota bacterium]